MDIRIYPDPVLRRGGQTITSFDAELRKTAEAMFEAMYELGGVGLAAPQVGIELKLLVLNPAGSADDRSGEMALCNPVLKRKKKMVWGEEGCLSFPGIYAEVERHHEISIEYQDLDGETKELQVDDFLARIIQHEMDHLTGILFIDRFPPAEKIRSQRKLEDLESRWAEAHA